MKLAEALSLRANVHRHIEQLRTRIANNARYQEGEEPSEDAGALLVEADEALREFEELIRRVNRTNAATAMEVDGTLTDTTEAGGHSIPASTQDGLRRPPPGNRSTNRPRRTTVVSSGSTISVSRFSVGRMAMSSSMPVANFSA